MLQHRASYKPLCHSYRIADTLDKVDKNFKHLHCSMKVAFLCECKNYGQELAIENKSVAIQ